MDVPAVKPKKKRKPLGPKRIKKNIDLEKMQKQNLTVLIREIGHLMQFSYKRKLDKQESEHLIEYIKLINDLKVLSQLDPSKESKDEESV